jgi:hypothetical protein
MFIAFVCVVPDSEFMPAFKSSSYRKKEVLGVRIGYGTTLRQMMRGTSHLHCLNQRSMMLVLM